MPCQTGRSRKHPACKSSAPRHSIFGACHSLLFAVDLHLATFYLVAEFQPLGCGKRISLESNDAIPQIIHPAFFREFLYRRFPLPVLFYPLRDSRQLVRLIRNLRIRQDMN